MISGSELTLSCSVSDLSAGVTFAWTDSNSDAVTSSDGAYNDVDDTQVTVQLYINILFTLL